MKKVMTICSLITLLTSGFSRGEEAQELLKRADEARGNLGGVRWEVELESHEKKHVTKRSYEVISKNFDFRANATSPARLRGNRLLMKKGSMWFHKPDLSKPVPVSRRQKLAGSAAYGDIASTNYAEDYDITAERDEVLNDGTQCRVFTLEAKTKKVTYDKIIYWIDVKRGVGVRAEYYSVSGKKLKSATMKFSNVITDEKGRAKPFISEMRIKDDLSDTAYTVMRFSKPQLRDVPDRLLNVQQLKK